MPSNRRYHPLIFHLFSPNSGFSPPYIGIFPLIFNLFNPMSSLFNPISSPFNPISCPFNPISSLFNPISSLIPFSLLTTVIKDRVLHTKEPAEKMRWRVSATVSPPETVCLS